jgi:hypothetical protein
MCRISSHAPTHGRQTAYIHTNTHTYIHTYIHTIRTHSHVQNFVTRANAPIFSVDKQLCICEWNLKCEQITGFAREEMIDRNIVDNFVVKGHRCVCMYVCMYVYFMYVCVCVLCVYRMCVYTYVCCMSVCLYACMHVCMHLIHECMYVYIYIYIYIYTYIHTYIHIHTYTY